MIVYADVLVVLNILIDYFLLGAAARLVHINLPLWRQLLSAVFGGFSSLVIFLPTQTPVMDFLLQCVICSALSLIAFGKPLRRTIRAGAVFLGVTYCYGGVMMALWHIFKPNGMVINNSVVYFDVTPIFLIIFSVAGYIIISIARRFLTPNGISDHACTAEIFLDGKSSVLNGLVDTGNSLEDTFSNGEVIIVDSAVFNSLLGFIPTAQDLPDRYRVIAGSSVSGTALLDAFRCDRAVITYLGRKIELHRPILALSHEPLGGDYDAILNPRSVL